MTPEQMENFRDCLSAEDYEFLVKAARDGVCAEYDGPRLRRASKPHETFMNHLDEGLRKLWKDARSGRTLFISDRGPVGG